MNIKSIEYAGYTSPEFYFYSITPPFFFLDKIKLSYWRKKNCDRAKNYFHFTRNFLAVEKFFKKKKKKRLNDRKRGKKEGINP